MSNSNRTTRSGALVNPVDSTATVPAVSLAAQHTDQDVAQVISMAEADGAFDANPESLATLSKDLYDAGLPDGIDHASLARHFVNKFRANIVHVATMGLFWKSSTMKMTALDESKDHNGGSHSIVSSNEFRIWKNDVMSAMVVVHKRVVAESLSSVDKKDADRFESRLKAIRNAVRGVNSILWSDVSAHIAQSTDCVSIHPVMVNLIRPYLTKPAASLTESEAAVISKLPFGHRTGMCLPFVNGVLFVEARSYEKASRYEFLTVEQMAARGINLMFTDEFIVNYTLRPSMFQDKLFNDDGTIDTSTPAFSQLAAMVPSYDKGVPLTGEAYAEYVAKLLRIIEAFGVSIAGTAPVKKSLRIKSINASSGKSQFANGFKAALSTLEGSPYFSVASPVFTSAKRMQRSDQNAADNIRMSIRHAILAVSDEAQYVDTMELAALVNVTEATTMARNLHQNSVEFKVCTSFISLTNVEATAADASESNQNIAAAAQRLSTLDISGKTFLTADNAKRCIADGYRVDGRYLKEIGVAEEAGRTPADLSSFIGLMLYSLSQDFLDNKEKFSDAYAKVEDIARATSRIELIGSDTAEVTEFLTSRLVMTREAFNQRIKTAYRGTCLLFQGGNRRSAPISDIPMGEDGPLIARLSTLTAKELHTAFTVYADITGIAFKGIVSEVFYVALIDVLEKTGAGKQAFITDAEGERVSFETYREMLTASGRKAAERFNLEDIAFDLSINGSIARKEKTANKGRKGFFS